jgi:hypothetical protein
MTTVLLDRVPRTGTPVDRWLTGLDDDVVLLTSEQAAPGYRPHLPDVRAFPDYDDNPAVVAELRALCARGGVLRIVHLTEGDLLRAARVRDEFGIPGPSYRDLLPYRDKILMKRRVRQAGLAVPDFAAIGHDTDAAREFALAHGHHVVIKPRDGAASRGVTVCRTEDEVDTALAGTSDGRWMIESHVPGGMLHIDGFCHEGVLLSCAVSEYVHGCLAFQESRPLASAQLDPEGDLHLRAQAFAARVVAALPPLDRSPFHLELFTRDGGGLVFCEIAARLGGGHIVDVLALSSGVNPAATTVRAQAGLPAEIPVIRPETRYGFVLVPPRAGTVTAVDTPRPHDWLDLFRVATPTPRTFTGAGASTDTVCSFVCHDQTNLMLRKRLDECIGMSATLTHWE